MTRARRTVGLLAAIALVLLASACQVDLRVDVALDDDGSGTVIASVGLDEEAAGRIPDLADQLRVDDLEAAGWTVTGPEADDEGTTWVRASKPFDDPDEASQILDDLAGPDGPFQDFSVSRSRSFAETTFAVEGVADFSDGLDDFTDQQLTELLGDGFGGNLDDIEAETGQPAAEQISVTFAAELPGGGVQELQLDPTSTEPQPIEAQSTSTRWATRVWALVAGAALALLVVVIVVRLVRDQRERRQRRWDDHPPEPEPEPERQPAPEPGAVPMADPDQPSPVPVPAGMSPASMARQPEAAPVASGEPAPSRPKRRLGVVVLDAMGVVFDTGVDVTSLLTDFLHEQGLYVAHDEVGAQLTRATLGQITPGELWRALGIERNQGEVTDQFLALHKPSAGLRAFLERMRERELPVVVVSNDVSAWSNQLRDTHKLVGLTSGWIVSSDLGHRLPDAAIYDEIVRVSGELPRDTFFIGRELRYLAAARAHGFATAWFNPDPEPGDEDAGYPMIRSFRDFGVG